ncbi:MAG: SMC-Scp complex subunit ScpB [Gemmataceae bacterium]|nr:SMC-Scp complex subunit ScpB [Gemmataceae bacterium]
MTAPDERPPGRTSWEVDAPDALEAAAAPPAPPAAPPAPRRIIEAFLFVGGPPLTATRAADAIRGLTSAQFLEAIAELNQEYRSQGRPYTIQNHDHGYVLTLRPRFRPVMEKLHGTTREARLSPAAVDVLALVAYRQPATRQEVDSLRGAESGSLLRQLVRRGLIAVVSRGEAESREVAYGTTPRFLELFGLSSLDDLPQTQDLQRL